MSLSEDVATQPGGPDMTRAWLRALEMTASIGGNPTRTLPVVIQELADKFNDAPALLSDRECLSHRQLAERMNRYGRWALAQNIAPGDVVALLMPSRPDYLAIWLGITAVGGAVSLLNVNQLGRSLAHSINIAKPKHIIVAAELADVFATAQSEVKGRLTVWYYGADANDIASLEREVERYSGAALTPAERRNVTIDDRALYMYTSGTTG